MERQATSIEDNGTARGPSRTTTWPPAWLREPLNPNPQTDAMPAAADPEPETDRAAAEGMAAPVDDQPKGPAAEPDANGQRCDRCGGREFCDVAISGGRIRRDCALCGRFVDFPKWYASPDAAAVSNKVTE